MLKRTITLVLLIATFAIASAGYSARVVYVRKAPPKVRREVIVVAKKPCPNAIRVKGHWHWNPKKGYVWVKAHWKRPLKGNVWVVGHWKKAPRGWFWVPGHWRKK